MSRISLHEIIENSFRYIRLLEQLGHNQITNQGMNTMEEMILVGEIALQIKIARRAAERLTSSDQIDVWGSIQSILVASGNVSKILWPSKRKRNQRGKELRSLLNVGDSNILKDRYFRNSFEHYDERVEEYLENRPSGAYVDLAMNPSWRESSPRPHRGYNSYNNTVVFRGEVLDLNELFMALDEILESCKPYVLT